MSELDRMKQNLVNMNYDYNKSINQVDPVEQALNGTERAKNRNAAGREIVDLQNKIYRQEEIERAREREQEYQQYKSTTDRIKTSAKEMYDSKMNAYMQMNFWGKAKTILAGKKPKKMSDSEIIQTYGSNAKQVELEKMIQRRQQQFQEQVAWEQQYYTEHPEDLKPDSPVFNSVENIIKNTTSHYNFDIENMKKDYQRQLEFITEQVEKGSMRL